MVVEMSTVDLRLCFFILAIINVVENKRYDIHQQCKEDYGLELSQVLRQFRRSDDYLKILKMRTDEFDDFFVDVLIQSLIYNIDLMKNVIQKDMGVQQVVSSSSVSDTKKTTITTTRPPSRMRHMKFHMRRRLAYDAKEMEDAARKMEKVRRLDQYPRLNSHLTVSERNHYKNLGFTYAGEVIHAVIRAFGGNPKSEAPVGSTRGTERAVNGTITTTEHMLKHVATNSMENTAKATTAATESPVMRSRSNTRFSLVSKSFIFGR